MMPSLCFTPIFFPSLFGPDLLVSMQLILSAYQSLSTYPSLHPSSYMHIWTYICMHVDRCFIVCTLLKFGTYICMQVAFYRVCFGTYLSILTFSPSHLQGEKNIYPVYIK